MAILRFAREKTFSLYCVWFQALYLQGWYPWDMHVVHIPSYLHTCLMSHFSCVIRTTRKWRWTQLSFLIFNIIWPLKAGKTQMRISMENVYKCMQMYVNASFTFSGLHECTEMLTYVHGSLRCPSRFAVGIKFHVKGACQEKEAQA